MLEKLVVALGPAFAAGFAVQQLLEIVAPIVAPAVDKIKVDKKLVLGLLSLVVGLVLAFGAGLRVLQPLGVANVNFVLDAIVTALIISAGTEGFNSIMKFLGYTKDKRGQDAGAK